MILYLHMMTCSIFFFILTLTTVTYTLSLHDALPIFQDIPERRRPPLKHESFARQVRIPRPPRRFHRPRPPLRLGIASWNSDLDRKSTRLNSSHLGISYAVFCLKKKK